MIVYPAMVVAIANGFWALRLSLRMTWLIYYFVQNSQHFQLLFFSHTCQSWENTGTGKFEKLLEREWSWDINPSQRSSEPAPFCGCFTEGVACKGLVSLKDSKVGLKGWYGVCLDKALASAKTETRETTRHNVVLVQNLSAELWLMSLGLLRGDSWGCV